MTAESILNLGEITTQNSYRCSKQRNLILDTLVESKKHLNAQELYELVRKKRPKISLGTVYRNLNLLQKLGLVNTIYHHGKKRYDGRLETHYHILCVNCDEMTDLEVDGLSGLGIQVDPKTRFRILENGLIFFGICPTCHIEL